ncbi:MAG TPA: putative quinol monooxygenase [Baekduia sp.]|nr:putative quinol monooxygenase [Baekduia sp.]
MSPHAEVVVAATITVKPESQDAALAALSTAIEATHAEPGCLAYALHRDRAEPTRFVIVEKWATAGDLEEHGQTPHLQQLFAELGPLLAGPPTITYTSPVPVGDGAKGAL